MADIQKVRFDEPLPRLTAKRGSRDTQSISANELPSVKRLDGEVVKMGDFPLSGGTHYDLWTGQWKKGSGEEKVSQSLATFILLILCRWP